MLGKCCCLKTTLHTVVVGLFFSLLQTIFVSYTCFSLHATQNLHLKLPIIHRMKWGVGKLLSPVWLFGTPCTVACQAPQSMGFSRQGYWSGLPCPSPGDLPDPGIEPRSPALQADSSPFEPPGKPLLDINCSCFARVNFSGRACRCPGKIWGNLGRARYIMLRRLRKGNFEGEKKKDRESETGR